VELTKDQRNELIESFATELVMSMEKTADTQDDLNNQQIHEAAEALVEAFIYKQAAISEGNDAALIAEASEAALNYLGYSMFTK